jgi:hypothetical protein
MLESDMFFNACLNQASEQRPQAAQEQHPNSKHLSNLCPLPTLPNYAATHRHTQLSQTALCNYCISVCPQWQ